MALAADLVGHALLAQGSTHSAAGTPGHHLDLPSDHVHRTSGGASDGAGLVDGSKVGLVGIRPGGRRARPAGDGQSETGHPRPVPSRDAR